MLRSRVGKLIFSILFFHSVGNVIIPTDEVIFWYILHRGIPPTKTVLPLRTRILSQSNIHNAQRVFFNHFINEYGDSTVLPPTMMRVITGQWSWFYSHYHNYWTMKMIIYTVYTTTMTTTRRIIAFINVTTSNHTSYKML